MRLFAELTKVDEQDDGSIMVHGIASSGARDEAGEIITPDAMKAAIPDFMKWGAIREMHGSSAAGTAVEMNVDADGFTQLCAHVVDPVAINKVRKRVYKGFSVGGKVLERDPKDRTVITKIKLVETSLVDRPCNPEAEINMWKADMADTEEQTMSEAAQPTADEVKKLAQEMADAAGKPNRRADYVVKAREQLIAKAAELVADEAAADATETVIEPTAEAVVKIDPAAALSEALAKAEQAGVVAPSEEIPSPQITPGLADIGKTLLILQNQYAEPLAKGMYQVSRLAQIVEAVSDLQMMSAWEEKAEGDTASTMPAMLATAVMQLGESLKAMATEEVAELLASLKETSPDIDVLIIDDDADVVALAQPIVDLVKADTAMMEKAGARHSKADMSKLQGIHDHAAAMGAKCDSGNCEKAADAEDLEKVTAERDGLSKALTDALPQIEGLAKRLDDQAQEIEILKAQPMPPKAAGSALATPVEKQADSTGIADQTAKAPTQIDMEKWFAALPEAERAHLAMKAAMANPIAISR